MRLNQAVERLTYIPYSSSTNRWLHAGVAIAIARHLLQVLKEHLLEIFRHASILHDPVGIPVLGKCQFGNVASGKAAD
jgi:hypothetical protein